MKSLKLWLLACTVALIAGCGGAAAEVVDEGEALLYSSETLSTCTATCATGAVSCPATTVNCTATNGVGVTCDGTTIACPPPPTCDELYSCSDYSEGYCEPGEPWPKCCTAAGTISSCRCLRYAWFCYDL
ncbi:hypothetical protein [Myxococcus sp. AB025B]|uniref:hypothetical protein n=1 Tax=Myxococcus sp. AB025B TaxID=2562794 RepID=UPI001142CE9A|nr:hypothetical protein [Myxococcus sp. AB025B]